MACCRLSVGRFVKAVVELLAADADGKRGQIGCCLGGKRRDEARIDAARKKHPDRNIGDDPMPYRSAQQLVELVDRLVKGGGPRRAEMRLPVALAADPAVLQREDRAGLELFDPAPPRSSPRQILEEQQIVGGLPVRPRSPK